MTSPRVGWAVGDWKHVGRVLHTTDGGRRWRDVTPVRRRSSPPLVTDFKGGLRAWAVFQVGPKGRWHLGFALYATTTAGLSWRRIWSGGLPAYPAALHFSDSRHGVLVADGCCTMYHDWEWMYATTDGGHHWHQIAYGCNDACGPTPAPPWASVLGGCDTTGFLFEGATTGYRAADGAVGPCLAVTTNGGRAWRAVPMPRILESQDGVNVSPPAAVPPDGVLVGLEVAPQRPLFLLILRDGQVSVRRFPSPHGDTLTPVDFVDPRHGWALFRSHNGDALYATSDGGASWAIRTRTNLPDEIDFLTPELGWAPGRPGSLLRTRDGGRRWFQIAFFVVH